MSTDFVDYFRNCCWRAFSGAVPPFGDNRLDVKRSPFVIESIGRVSILVRDQEEAKRWYTEKLRFSVIADLTLENGFRALHVGPGDPPVTGFWLVPAPDGERGARVGNQTGGEPLAVLYTADCRKTHAELTAAGVHFPIPPVETPDDIHAHFRDLYGNEFVLVELKRQAKNRAVALV
jgi:catechol 2,3-dioxygenase-like lactoylglutathione lyase family enzyme